SSEYKLKAISTMFLAALMSRSWTQPQAAHLNSRSDSRRLSFLHPQLEHVLLVGSNLPHSRRFIPFQRHLYLICLRNSPQLALEIGRDNFLFRSIPRMFNDSTHNVSTPWLSQVKRCDR